MHGLTNEADQKAWIQKFGEFKGWDAAGAGSQPLQGPPTPGMDQPAPGGVGPPTPGAPQPLGQSGPDHSARMAKIMDLARTAPNLETAHAFLNAVEADDMKAAVQAHGTRVLTNLRNIAAQGGLTKKLAGGAEDPSGNDIANQLADQLQQFLASPESSADPRAAAQYVDHIEQEMQATQAQTVQSNTIQHLRQLQGDRMLKQIQEKWQTGTSMNDLAGAVAYYNTYMGAVDANPKDLGAVEKEFNDELSGMGPIKREAMQHKWESDQLRAQNEAQRLEIQRLTEEAKTPRRLGEIAAQGEEARKTEDLKNQLKRDRPPAPASVGERAHAISAISGVLKSEFPMHGLPNESDQDKAAYAEREKALRADSGLDEARTNGKLTLPGPKGADSAESIVKDYKAGLADKAEVQRRAAVLKLTEAQVKALFGVK